jgi:hypothetical protein
MSNKDKIRGKKYKSEKEMDEQNERFNKSEEWELENDPYFDED